MQTECTTTKPRIVGWELGRYKRRIYSLEPPCLLPPLAPISPKPFSIRMSEDVIHVKRIALAFTESEIDEFITVV